MTKLAYLRTERDREWRKKEIVRHDYEIIDFDLSYNFSLCDPGYSGDHAREGFHLTLHCNVIDKKAVGADKAEFFIHAFEKSFIPTEADYKRIDVLRATGAYIQKNDGIIKGVIQLPKNAFNIVIQALLAKKFQNLGIASEKIKRGGGMIYGYDLSLKPCE